MFCLSSTGVCPPNGIHTNQMYTEPQCFVVSALEFAYLMAPKSMKGIIMGFFYLFTGIGSFLGTGFMYVFDGMWFFGKVDFGNINCRLPCTKPHMQWNHSCHLDYYFFSLAALEFLGIFVFLIVAHCLSLNRHLLAVTKQKHPNKVPSITNKTRSTIQRSSLNRQRTREDNERWTCILRKIKNMSCLNRYLKNKNDL